MQSAPTPIDATDRFTCGHKWSRSPCIQRPVNSPLRVGIVQRSSIDSRSRGDVRLKRSG
jgi:hypothetical protein